MKKLQQGTFLTILAALMMAALVGCSGGGASTEKETQAEVDKTNKGLQGVPDAPADSVAGPFGGKKGGGAAATTGS
jgi:hypothetical protein